MRTAIALAALLMPLCVGAADTGFYAGVSVGHAVYDRTGPAGNGIPRAPFGDRRANPYRGIFQPAGQHSFVDFQPVEGRRAGDGLAWRILAGYRFTSRFSVETAWVDIAAKYDRHEQSFSNADVQFAFPAVTGRFITDLEVPVHGATLSGVGRWPVTERLALLVRIGALFWDADIDVSVAQTRVTVVPELDPPFVSGVIDRTRSFRNGVDDDGISPALGLGMTFHLVGRLHLRGDYDYYHDVAGDDVHTFQAGLQYEF